MAELARSMARLFIEINDKWPSRDHRTDGWYADPKERISKGHNPGHRGLSHAIDVDDDGIDESWIISHIAKNDKVLWYIIWNRKLYSNTYNWVPRTYTGSNPHTDHMHIEIYQTTYAEDWAGYWGISPSGSTPGQTPPAPSTSSPGGTFSGDFGPNYGSRDYRGHFVNLGNEYSWKGVAIGNAALSVRSLRR
jgi:hypothetical protein